MTTATAAVAVAGEAAMTTDARRGDSGSDSEPRQPQAARRPAKPPAGWVFGAALAVFFAALALLAFQVRAGRDPALGPAQPVAQVQAKPRRVLIRRVIERVVIHAPRRRLPSRQARLPRPRRPLRRPRRPRPRPAPLTTQSS